MRTLITFLLVTILLLMQNLTDGSFLNQQCVLRWSDTKQQAKQKVMNKPGYKQEEDSVMVYDDLLLNRRVQITAIYKKETEILSIVAFQFVDPRNEDAEAVLGYCKNQYGQPIGTVREEKTKFFMTFVATTYSWNEKKDTLKLITVYKGNTLKGMAMTVKRK